MEELNYEKLMALNPTEYDRITNQLGQEVVFYEHPLQGDEHPVIAVFHKHKVAAVTDFYDTADFYEDSEYLPIYDDGKVDYAYEFGFLKQEPMNKDVLEGNKLIAEFMGITPSEKGWYDGYELQKAGLPFSYGAMGNGTNDVKFHDSWDWLMPVLAKIGSKTGHELVIHSETSYWNQFGDNALIFDFLGYEYPLQDGIWKAVVEFIKWYNENNKTNDYAGINY